MQPKSIPLVAIFLLSAGMARPAVTLLLDAAAKSGAIRKDIDPQDVLLAVAASTWSFASDKDWKDRTGRVLRLVLDGLRYRAGK